MPGASSSEHSAPTNPSAFYTALEDVPEDGVVQLANGLPHIPTAPRYPPTMEDLDRPARAAGELDRGDDRFQDLDDRKENRRAREAGGKQKAGHRLPKFLKKFGKKPKKDKGKAPVVNERDETPPTPGHTGVAFREPSRDDRKCFYACINHSPRLRINPDFDVLYDIHVHKGHDGQRDMAQTEPTQESKQFVVNFLHSMRNKIFIPNLMKPVVVALAVRTNRSHLWARMKGLLFTEAQSGWVIIEETHKSFTMTFKVIAKGIHSCPCFLSCTANAAIAIPENLRKDVTLDMELFAISQGKRPIARGLIRLIQRSGPADCVHRVAEILQDWLHLQDFHMPDALEAEDMKKALNLGLEPRLELPTRVSRDGVYEGTL